MLGLLTAGFALAADGSGSKGSGDEKEKKAQTTCPLMGGAINKDIYADHDGKRVYFCSKGCVAAFEKDPEKYIVKLEKEGVEIAAAPVRKQTTCPLMGGAIKKDLYADHDGKRVYFCCQGCVAAFKKDPAKVIKKLEDEGIPLARTPRKQSVCPMSGKAVRKDAFADKDGKRVYFCGPGCAKAFKKDPSEILKKLEADNVILEKTPAAEPARPNRGSSHKGSSSK